MKACLNCGWQGNIETEEMPEDRADFADYCPACGRQTLQQKTKSLIENLKRRGVIGE